jgi:hypothetical protein
MAAKRSGFSVRLILVAALATGMIVSSVVAYQQGQHGSDGIFFEIYGGGITAEPEAMLQISIAHTCVFNDELILEKVEICAETGVSVKTLEVNGTLNSIFWKKILLEPLAKLVYIPIVGVLFHPVAGELYDEIQAELFSPYWTIDLRQVKPSLTDGDDILIIVKATLIHNEKRLTLEREVLVEYSSYPLS